MDSISSQTRLMCASLACESMTISMTASKLTKNPQRPQAAWGRTIDVLGQLYHASQRGSRLVDGVEDRVLVRRHRFEGVADDGRMSATRYEQDTPPACPYKSTYFLVTASDYFSCWFALLASIATPMAIPIATPIAMLPKTTPSAAPSAMPRARLVPAACD